MIHCERKMFRHEILILDKFCQNIFKEIFRFSTRIKARFVCISMWSNQKH